MISALVNTETKLVENMIVADPTVDETPAGYLMIANPPAFVTIGTSWDGKQFVNPGGTFSTAKPGMM